LVDAPEDAILRTVSIEGSPRVWASFGQSQWGDERALLALRVNGADLSPDHGYPARIMVPNAPGTHNTKWVRELRFEAA
jgi:hypothetical protein